MPGEAADNAPDLDPGAFSRLRLHVRWCPRRVRVCAALTAALSAAVPLRTVSTCAHFLFGRRPFKLLVTSSSELGADAPVTKVLVRRFSACLATWRLTVLLLTRSVRLQITQSGQDGSQCGIGVVFRMDNHGALVVDSLVPGGPAWESSTQGGLQVSDVLQTVDGKNVYRYVPDCLAHTL